MKRNAVHIGLIQTNGAEVAWHGYARVRVEVPARGAWSNEHEACFSCVNRGCFDIGAFGIFVSGSLREDPILVCNLSARLLATPGLEPRFAVGALLFDSNVLWMIDTYLLSFAREEQLGGGPS